MSPSTVALSPEEEAEALSALSGAYSDWHAASRDAAACGAAAPDPPDWLPQMRCIVQAGVPKVSILEHDMAFISVLRITCQRGYFRRCRGACCKAKMQSRQCREKPIQHVCLARHLRQPLQSERNRGNSCGTSGKRHKVALRCPTGPTRAAVEAVHAVGPEEGRRRVRPTRPEGPWEDQVRQTGAQPVALDASSGLVSLCETAAP